MGKYKRELIVALMQLAIFWLLPLAMLKVSPMSAVLIMLMCTLVLAVYAARLSKNNIKYVLPLFAAVMFLPTVPVYYNSSALIHALWYFVSSAAGMAAGMLSKKI
ncbi:MAG: hypothetical protein IKU32_01440 [Clostridia bacterium]|nr:hypothetical protein [Clostridia bacterium]